MTSHPLDIPNWIGRNKPSKYVAEIDEAELAVRMVEAAIGLKRPPGATARETLADADWGPAFERAARAAMEYWQECLVQMNEAQ